MISTPPFFRARFSAVAGLLALVVLFAACSDDGGGEADDTSSSSTPPTTVEIDVHELFEQEGEPRPPTGDPGLLDALMTPDDVADVTAAMKDIEYGGATIPSLPARVPWEYSATRGPELDVKVCNTEEMLLARPAADATAWASFAAGNATSVDEELRAYASADEAVAAMAAARDAATSCRTFPIAVGNQTVTGNVTALELLLPEIADLGADEYVGIRIIFTGTGGSSQMDWLALRFGSHIVHVNTLFGGYGLPVESPGFARKAIEAAGDLLGR